MKNVTIRYILFTISISLLLASCSKNAVGYVEVRNHLDQEITDVSWGSEVNLGTIGIEGENGEETKLFGTAYIYLRHDNMLYRSDTAIEVDARTSATYIVDDLSKLVSEE